MPVLCRHLLRRRCNPFPFQKQLVVQIGHQFVQAIRQEELPELLQVLGAELVQGMLAVEKLKKVKVTQRDDEFFSGQAGRIPEQDVLLIVLLEGSELEVPQERKVCHVFRRLAHGNARCPWLWVHILAEPGSPSQPKTGGRHRLSHLPGGAHGVGRRRRSTWPPSPAAATASPGRTGDRRTRSDP